MEHKFEHLLYKEDVAKTIKVLEKQGRSVHAEDIYESIEQRMSLGDIRKALRELNRCDNCGCRLFTPDPLHICRSRK